MRETEIRTKNQALAVYLFWLKTGLNQRQIAAHFGIESHFEVFRYLNQVRKALVEDFVPKHLGIKHMDRQGWLEQNTKIAKELFAQDENQLIIIFDGTYCKIEKSSNYYFQRITFSGQKGYNLVKPFVCTATNGRILDIFGLHPANDGDGDILKDVLEKDSSLKEFLKSNDILILDRGFTRVSNFLKEVHGLTPMIPSSIKNGEKQLSTLEANKSRLVTKCRWVVEVLNSFIKRSFRALDGVTNKELDHTLEDYRIAAAFVNKYFQRLYSDNDNVEIARKMKKRLDVPNLLSDFVKENKLHKKSLFFKLEAAQINDFPVLSVDDIVNEFTFGNYQINQAKSYLGQHFSGDGKKEFFVNSDKSEVQNGKILFGQVRSRFRNLVKYKTYVNYEPNRNSIDALISWYCTCICGSRTVGCCSHVASLVLFFSNLKYSDDINWPAEYLTKFFDPESEPSDNETQESLPDSLPYKNLSQLTNKTTEFTQTSNDKPKTSLIKRELSNLSQVEPKKSKIPNNSEGATTLTQCEKSMCNDEICFTTLISKIPKWGGEFYFDEKLVRLENTCSFEYFLFGIWVSSILSENFLKALTTCNSNDLDKIIYKLITLIENNSWNEVKKFWLVQKE